MSTFQVGCFVWAKLKGYPLWPGLICEAPEGMGTCEEEVRKFGFESAQYRHCVFLFGRHLYFWVDEKNLLRYEERKEMCRESSSYGKIISACREIEELISTGSSKIPEVQEMIRKSGGFAVGVKSVKASNSEEKGPPKKKLNLSNGSTSMAGKQEPMETSSVAKRIFELVSQEQRGEKIIGFIGLGEMGSRIATNLLNSGHKLVVWNRSQEKCHHFVATGAQMADSAKELVEMCDMVFSCVSGPAALRDVVLGFDGALRGISEGKGYIDLSMIDKRTSVEMANKIEARGGRYLEVQMMGDRDSAEKAQLVFLCAGDQSLYGDCAHYLLASSSRPPVYLGPVGLAVTTSMLVHAVQAIFMGMFTEQLAISSSYKMSPELFKQFFGKLDGGCKLLEKKFNMMNGDNEGTAMPLAHLQKTLGMLLEACEESGHSMPLTSIVNTNLKYALRLGYGSHDAAIAYRKVLDQ